MEWHLSNPVKVLDAIRLGGGDASKKNIATRTGMAWGTMCKAVNALLERGAVSARREKSSSPGRPSIPLTVNPDFGIWGGVDLGSAGTKLVFTDFNFRILFQETFPTEPFSTTERFYDWFGGHFFAALERSGVEKGKLLGVGLAVSGIVDAENGVIVSGGNWNLKHGTNVPLEVLSRRLEFPLFAVTTQSGAVTAEYHFGERAYCPNLVTIGLGVGIGSGVIANHQLLISHPDQPVGYIGHILIPGNRRRCSCGFTGCLESRSGGEFLRGIARETMPNHPELHDAAALDCAAAAGDPGAMAIMSTAAEYNAAGVAAMIQLYSPSALIFSGAQSRPDGFLYNTTLEKLRDILPRERRNCFLGITKLGAYQSALGAARLACERFF